LDEDFTIALYMDEKKTPQFSQGMVNHSDNQQENARYCEL
jgi:hypothetical protein